MHELLVPLLFSLEKEMVTVPWDDIQSTPHLPLAILFDAQYLEADLYWLFDALMNEIHPFYYIYHPPKIQPLEQEKKSPEDHIDSPMSSSCQHIMEILNRFDANLAQHMKTISIEPQV